MTEKVDEIIIIVYNVIGDNLSYRRKFIRTIWIIPIGIIVGIMIIYISIIVSIFYWFIFIISVVE